ncbi:MAG: hypothetical protein HZB47_03920 [Nitrosomonadales bacterium]|nr:hypothetical protein [Nitrosomonadales bacterium]
MAFQTVRHCRLAARMLVCAVLVLPRISMGNDADPPPPAGSQAEQPQSLPQQSQQQESPPKKSKRTKPVKASPPVLPPPAEEPLESVLGVADAPRDYLSDKLVGFVASIDRFFADDRHYQETNGSVFQVDITRVTGYGGERRFVVAGRANVSLPIAEERLHLLLETDPDRNATVDPKQAQTQPLTQPRPTGTPKSYAAALRYAKAEAERWHFSADAGLKFQGLNTSPFVRTRASLARPAGDWRMKLAETLFWFNSTGAGESTQLDFERPISEPLLLRATSSATWLHDQQNFDMRQDLTLFHKLDDRAALLYQASVIGVSRPQAQVMDCVLLMAYRYRLHRQWMYFDLSPQLHFPRDRDFRSSPALSMRLEILFDETK